MKKILKKCNHKWKVTDIFNKIEISETVPMSFGFKIYILKCEKCQKTRKIKIQHKI